METCLSSVRAQRSPRLSERLVTTKKNKKNPTLNLSDIHAPVTYQTCTHEVSKRRGEQWDGAVKWGGLVTLSGDVRGFSQVDGEPQGCAFQREDGSKEELEAGKKRRKSKHFQETNERVREMKTKCGKAHCNETKVAATDHLSSTS